MKKNILLSLLGIVSILILINIVSAATLTLYMRENSLTGPALSGVRITGYDGYGKYFSVSTNQYGGATIYGTPGTWSFSASKTGYQPSSWTKSISYSTTNNGFLTKIVAYPSSVTSPVDGALEIVNTLTACSNTKWCFNQHKTSPDGIIGHILGGGVCHADDTYAWDANLNTPYTDSDNSKPVYAAASGVVVSYAGCDGGSVGQVLIEHNFNGNKWWSGYLHMKNIQVKRGQSVNENTIIGYVSNVGVPDYNNHLHFVTYRGTNTYGGLSSFNLNIVPRGSSPSPAPTPSCVPKTCSQLGKQCGGWDNGCQQSINCGTCSSGQTCSTSGQCVSSTPTCTSQCSLSQTRCTSQVSETCGDYNNDGCYEWGKGVSCTNACYNGGCTSLCVPNSKYCSGNYVETCNADGSGSNGIQCTNGQSCSNGQCISQTCTPNWSCGSFSICVNGLQTRTCNDINNCGTSNGKPITSQSCTSTTSTNSHTADCSFITSVKPAGSSWTLNDYINWASPGWIAIDVDNDNKKEIFGFQGDNNVACPSDDIYRHPLLTSALGGFKLQYFNNPNCPTCQKNLLVCSSNGYVNYALNYNVPSNPDLSCS